MLRASVCGGHRTGNAAASPWTSRPTSAGRSGHAHQALVGVEVIPNGCILARHSVDDVDDARRRYSKRHERSHIAACVCCVNRNHCFTAWRVGIFFSCDLASSCFSTDDGMLVGSMVGQSANATCRTNCRGCFAGKLGSRFWLLDAFANGNRNAPHHDDCYDQLADVEISGAGSWKSFRDSVRPVSVDVLPALRSVVYPRRSVSHASVAALVLDSVA